MTGTSMLALGHLRPIDDVRGMSVIPLIATEMMHRGELRRPLQSSRHPVPKYRIIKITRIIIEIASEPVEAACRHSRIARSRGSAGAAQSGA